MTFAIMLHDQDPRSTSWYIGTMPCNMYYKLYMQYNVRMDAEERAPRSVRAENIMADDALNNDTVRTNNRRVIDA